MKKVGLNLTKSSLCGTSVNCIEKEKVVALFPASGQTKSVGYFQVTRLRKKEISRAFEHVF